VNDVDAAIEFYRKMLDFKVEMHPAPEFAILSRGDFRFFLTKPSGRGTPQKKSRAKKDQIETRSEDP